jgi:putative transposase
VAVRVAGVQNWLWRAFDGSGRVLDVLVQRRRDTLTARRLLRKLLKRQGRPPRVLITDKLGSYSAAKGEIMPCVEHWKHNESCARICQHCAVAWHGVVVARST